jgi:hypothetical protein
MLSGFDRPRRDDADRIAACLEENKDQAFSDWGERMKLRGTFSYFPSHSLLFLAPAAQTSVKQ